MKSRIFQNTKNTGNRLSYRLINVGSITEEQSPLKFNPKLLFVANLEVFQIFSAVNLYLWTLFRGYPYITSQGGK